MRWDTLEQIWKDGQIVKYHKSETIYQEIPCLEKVKTTKAKSLFL